MDGGSLYGENIIIMKKKEREARSECEEGGRWTGLDLIRAEPHLHTPPLFLLSHLILPSEADTEHVVSLWANLEAAKYNVLKCHLQNNRRSFLFSFWLNIAQLKVMRCSEKVFTSYDARVY